jgi:hypothetical protein
MMVVPQLPVEVLRTKVALILVVHSLNFLQSLQEILEEQLGHNQVDPGERFKNRKLLWQF